MKDINFPSILEAVPDALVIVNESGEVIFFNAQAETLFGFTEEEIQGHSIDVLMPQRFRKRHQGHLATYFAHPRIRRMGEGLELYGMKKSGEEFPIEISLSPLESRGAPRALAAIRDITERKKAEAKFKGILEATPDALVIINQAGNIVLVNTQAEKLFKFSRVDLLDKPIEVLIPQRFHKRHGGHIANYFKEPRVRPMGAGLELYGKNSQEEEFPIEISLSPLESEGGMLALAAVRDITERKKAEAKFKGILEATPDALVIINQAGNIVLVNAQAEKLFKFSRADLLDKPIEVLIPQRFHERHGGHIANYFKEPRVRPMGAGLELYGKNSQEEEFPIEISLSPLESEEGMLALAAVRDITERKKAEAKFEGILEATPDALVIINQAGNIVLVNAQAEKLFNFSRAELLDRSVDILIPNRFHGKHHGHIGTYFHYPRNRPMGQGLELYGKKKAGEEFPIEISLSPLESEEGKLALAAIRDVTERKHYEQALKELAAQSARAKVAEQYQQMQEEFTDTLCHELRNPLNVIQGIVDLLNDKVKSIKKHHARASDEISMKDFLHQFEQDITAMKESSQLQRIIVDEVLDYSKLKSDKVELHPLVFNLQKLINSIVQIYLPQAREKNLDIQIQAPKEEVWLIADPFRLKQIIINLLSNAIKFTDKGSIKIIVDVESLPDDRDAILKVVVKDTGIGMTQYELSNLFKRFSQASRKTATAYGGTGLGLLISKKLTKKMGGDIQAKSTSGKGSAFTFTICASYPTPEEKALLDQGIVSPVSQRVKEVEPKVENHDVRILVVEDNKLNQRLLKNYLNLGGYQYEMANNGLEAVELFKKSPFDIILMDIEMPVMGGLEATQKIREEEENRAGLSLDKPITRIPIIGLSANAGEKHVALAIGSGMSGYLTKPYYKEQLFEVIGKFTAPLVDEEEQNQEPDTLLSLYDQLTLLGKASPSSDYSSLGRDDSKAMVLAKRESLKMASRSGRIGPRHLVDFILRDVNDEGNCFYEAVATQLQLLRHPFIHNVPSGTHLHDSLRLAVQGESFSDRQWADDITIDRFVKKFDVILAVIDTRNSKAGFICYYRDADGDIITNAFGEMPLPQKPIIRIAATGNHFLSVDSHPALERGAIRQAFMTSSRYVPELAVSQFFKKHYEKDYLIENRNMSSQLRREFDKRFGLVKEYHANSVIKSHRL